MPVMNKPSGIISPMQVKVYSNVSNGDYSAALKFRGNGAEISKPVSESEGNEATSTIIDMTDSVEHVLTGLVDEIDEKTIKNSHEIDNIKNKVERNNKATMDVIGLAFRALLSTKSLEELSGISSFVNDTRYALNGSAQSYEPVISAIQSITSAKEMERGRANMATPAATDSYAGGAVAMPSQIPSQTPSVRSKYGNGHPSERNTAAKQGNSQENSLRSTPARRETQTADRKNNNNRTSAPQGLAHARDSTNEHTNNRYGNSEHSIIERKRNLIISEIPEDLESGDKGGVELLLKEMGLSDLIQDIMNCTRLGIPNENRMRLLKVEMRNEEVANKILEKKGILNEFHDYATVYINEDLCKADRVKAYHARLNRRNTASESLNIQRNRRGGNFSREQSSQQGTNTRDGGRVREERRTQQGENTREGGRHRENQQTSYRVRGLPEGWVAMRSKKTGREYYVRERVISTNIEGKGQYEFPTEPANRNNRNRGWGRNRRQGNEAYSSQKRMQEYGGENGGNRNTGTSSGNSQEWEGMLNC